MKRDHSISEGGFTVSEPKYIGINKHVKWILYVSDFKSNFIMIDCFINIFHVCIFVPIRYRNGSQLQNQKDKYEITDNALTIKSPSVKDAGNYECGMNGSAKETIILHSELKFHYMPHSRQGFYMYWDANNKKFRQICLFRGSNFGSRCLVHHS